MGRLSDDQVSSDKLYHIMAQSAFEICSADSMLSILQSTAFRTCKRFPTTVGKEAMQTRVSKLICKFGVQEDFTDFDEIWYRISALQAITRILMWFLGRSAIYVRDRVGQTV
jgi:hypothetical protein